MKRPWYYYFVFIATFPVDLICLPVLLLARLFVGKRMFFRDGLWVELKKRPRSFAGLNIGHGGFLEPGFGATTMTHELVHVEQYQAVSWTGLMAALVTWLLYVWTFWFDTHSLWMFGAWPLVGILHAVGNWLVAVLRGEDSYNGAAHEEAARAVTHISHCGDNCCKRTRSEK